MAGNSSYPRRHRARLADYDYRSPGYYSVTVCTHGRQTLFGSLDHESVHLNPAGEMVRSTWTDLSLSLPGIAIDANIVMPDHIHTIVVLEDDPRRTISLLELMRRYKSLTTTRYGRGVREQGWASYHGKVWQDGFYDRVIRDDAELAAMRRYIVWNATVLTLRREAFE